MRGRLAPAVNASGRVASPTEITSSLQHISEGRLVEGIVTFPSQPNAGGLTLRLRLQERSGDEVFVFALSGIIHPVPVTSSSPSPSAATS
jgi:hypothetical protein